MPSISISAGSVAGCFGAPGQTARTLHALMHTSCDTMQEVTPNCRGVCGIPSSSDKGGNSTMPRPLRTLPLCAATAALAGYVYLRHRQIHFQQEQPFGHYTARQIMGRTFPLCQTLWPDDDRAAVSAEH